MAYCRRAMLALDNFGGFTSRILPKAVTRKPISRIYSTLSSTLASNKPKFPGFSTWYGRITRTTQHRPFLSFSKRYYHGDEGGHPSKLDHYRSEFKRRWFQWFDWVRKDHKRGLAAVLVGSGLVVTVLFGRFETIPYSKRTHFVILKTDWEKKLGASMFNEMKERSSKAEYCLIYIQKLSALGGLPRTWLGH
ncbi:hypothetical protein M0R45_037932 [Rubus argutus]|uniref:Uncharacterized protein n=1 Tax=Rubus argutus TaxID=59490 RepID=A0AAW1W5K5_RUBAR